MPSNWMMIENSFPSFTGRESAREMSQNLLNYMRILVEELKYQLNNLDTTNWNEAALKKLQESTTEDLDEQMVVAIQSVKNVMNEVSSIALRLNTAEYNIRNLETDVADLQREHVELDNRLEEQEGYMEMAQADIDELQQQVLGVLGKDENGNPTLGGAGLTLHLIGSIYVNGKLIE